MPQNLARTIAELVRLPAVFTAMADIALGCAVTIRLGSGVATALDFCFLLMASSCIYLAGMILNDVADVEQDRHSRQFRPIPSGRIARRTALILGLALLAAGLASSALVRAQDYLAFEIAATLCLAVVFYNSLLTRPWQRLLLMPTCRFLNVLLGLSAADPLLVPWSLRLYLAAVVALYILGVTLFARNEDRHSSRATLEMSLVLMGAAVVMALAPPVLTAQASTSFFAPYLVLTLLFAVGMPSLRALRDPRPAFVQATIRRALQCLIVLDAALASSLVGPAGLLILLLLLPNWYFGRWLSST
jgi:4-hydroxybenzoate polyprenyltransferase